MNQARTALGTEAPDRHTRQHPQTGETVTRAPSSRLRGGELRRWGVSLGLFLTTGLSSGLATGSSVFSLSAGLSPVLVGIAALTGLTPLTACNPEPPREANGVRWLTREEAGPLPDGASCPVMDEDAKPGFSVSYKGQLYHLCCKKCVRAFQANPEKYLEGGDSGPHHTDEDE